MSTGTVPAQPASPAAPSPRPLAAFGGMASADLSGYIDGVHTKIAVIPEAVENLMSGIIVKAPTAAWGGLAAGGSADYGKGQFISFHRFLAGSTDPNNTLMFRVDKTGGMGLTGGVHIATGLRQDVGYTTTQAVWINPTLDLVDIVMTGVAAKIQPFLLATNSVGGVLFKVLNNGAIQSAADIAARFGLSTQVALGDVAGFPSIQFGNDSTTFLARGSIAGRIKATSYMDAAKDITAWLGDTNRQVLIGDVYGSGVGGVGFGTALDTVAYRNNVGQLGVSNALAVINTTSTSNIILSLRGVAGQTGDYVRGINSVGATVWSISAAGVFSPATGSPDPISITGNVTAHNADARLTLIGDIFGSAGIGMGTTADTIMVRASAGAAQISDTLTVQNVSHSSANVIAAIGASGQSGYLFLGVQSTGGTVFGVTNAGAVSAVSYSGSSAALGAISGSSLNVTGAIIGGATSVGAITASGLDVGSGVISGQYLRGVAGGNAMNLTTSDGGHNVYFHWNAGTSRLEIYIDGVAAISMAYGMTITGSTPKAFVIDHPTDRDRWLIHACLEGPTADVYYRGTGRLDHGVAVIELPGYFESLTHRDGRTVQVTPMVGRVGDRVPHLHVTRPADGRFEVGSDDATSCSEFCWEVKAVRRDVDPLHVEPRKSEVRVGGQGPYRYYEAVPDFGAPIEGPPVHQGVPA